MKYRRVSRSPLRSLTSEMVPYEVPLPFSTARLYAFLRHIRFEWLDKEKFQVSKNRFGKAEKYWLELILDIEHLKPTRGGTGDRLVFDAGTTLLHPFKYWARRNNGKRRNLAIPHPKAMLRMARFINDYRDSILYYSNRSAFSIRYPSRVARLHVRRDSTFAEVRDRDSYGLEQADLEYEYASSFFAYRRYNNINRFYGSSEFRSYERKYPKLLRLDVAKCFDSIYTHTLSWVTNGVKASKESRKETDETFGGRFDKQMRDLNYGETSGIIIGPEFSRIFAEIILQEVDIRLERDLRAMNLVAGQDYETLRYVDDYFIFLADATKANDVERVLSQHLSDFKLHLNDHKQHEFDTPLGSHMSVAKLKLRENLKQRTKCEVDLGESGPIGELWFSASRMILDYKATLIDSELDHGELANSFLYELGRRVEKTLDKYRKYMSALEEDRDPKRISASQSALVRYLIANLEVALFIYSGSPSVSHSIKVTQLIVSSIRELEANNLGLLQIQAYRDKVTSELLAQLSAVKDKEDFGVHTLLLVDCLIYLSPDIDEAELRKVLEKRERKSESLDAFSVLTFLRRFTTETVDSELRDELLDRASVIIDKGDNDKKFEAERAMLLLSLPTMPGLTLQELTRTTGLSNGKARELRSSRVTPALFAWNASDDYFQRLQLKIAQMVY